MKIVKLLIVLVLCGTTTGCAKASTPVPPHTITQELLALTSIVWNEEDRVEYLVDSAFRTGIKADREAIYVALDSAKIRYRPAMTMGGKPTTASSSFNYRFLFQKTFRHDSCDVQRVIDKFGKTHSALLTGDLTSPPVKDTTIINWLYSHIGTEDTAASLNALYYIDRHETEEKKKSILSIYEKVKSERERLRVLWIFIDCIKTEKDMQELMPYFRKTKSHKIRLEIAEQMLRFNTAEFNTIITDILSDVSYFPDDYRGIFHKMEQYKRKDLLPLVYKVKEQGRFNSRRDYQELLDSLEAK